MTLRKHAEFHHLLEILDYPAGFPACISGQMFDLPVQVAAAQPGVALRQLKPPALADSETDHARKEKKREQVDDPSCHAYAVLHDRVSDVKKGRQCGKAQTDSAEYLVQHVGNTAHPFKLVRDECACHLRSGLHRLCALVRVCLPPCHLRILSCLFLPPQLFLSAFLLSGLPPQLLLSALLLPGLACVLRLPGFLSAGSPTVLRLPVCLFSGLPTVLFLSMFLCAALSIVLCLPLRLFPGACDIKGNMLSHFI